MARMVIRGADIPVGNVLFIDTPEKLESDLQNYLSGLPDANRSSIDQPYIGK